MEGVRTLSDQVAEEVRALLARRRMSQRVLAGLLGVSPAWVNYRMTGVQEIGVNDLQRIAAALNVPVTDLLPADVSTTATRTEPPPRLTTKYQASAARPRDNRPKGGPRRSSAKPGLGRPALLPRPVAA